MTVDNNLGRRVHILQELGFTTRRAGEQMHGTAVITPEMHVPGTTHLRTSILAIWADMIAGLLAAIEMQPRVPVTLELDVNVLRPAPAEGEVKAIGRTVKAGRSVFVAEIEFAVDGELAAVGGASFMAAPDPDVRLPPKMSFDLPESGVRLALPLAERAACTRTELGVATLPRSEDGLNASNTVNGGLIALVAEEAVLSLAPEDSLSFLGLRYLQPARVGPVVATARLDSGVGRVQVCDEGNASRLTTLVTARTFGPQASA